MKRSQYRVKRWQVTNFQIVLQSVSYLHKNIYQECEDITNVQLYITVYFAETEIPLHTGEAERQTD